MPGRSYSSQTAYRFGFNGIEETIEVKSYSSEYRELDVRIGRWWSCDPLAKNFGHLSPYCSHNNNPILCEDREGNFGKPANGPRLPVHYMTGRRGFMSSRNRLKDGSLKPPRGYNGMQPNNDYEKMLAVPPDAHYPDAHHVRFFEQPLKFEQGRPDEGTTKINTSTSSEITSVRVIMEVMGDISEYNLKLSAVRTYYQEMAASYSSGGSFMGYAVMYSELRDFDVYGVDVDEFYRLQEIWESKFTELYAKKLDAELFERATNTKIQSIEKGEIVDLKVSTQDKQNEFTHLPAFIIDRMVDEVQSEIGPSPLKQVSDQLESSTITKGL